MMQSCKVILCLLREELKWCKTTSGADIVNLLTTEPETPEIFQEVIKRSAENNCNENTTGKKNNNIVPRYQFGSDIPAEGIKEKKISVPCLNFEKKKYINSKS